jgi:large subunit ribosomal protein L32e
MAKKRKLFVRKDSWKFPRFGKGRKTQMKWRASKGMHGKIRLKHKGYQAQPSVGYKRPVELRGKISGLIPRMIYNESDLDKMQKGEVALIGKIGIRKKILIVEKAMKAGIKITNVNGEEFLKKFNLKGKPRKSEDFQGSEKGGNFSQKTK